ncbi:hypothetical protein HYC85_014706 [Camellia sinensis]|uniref:NAD(P)H dehydrogenase (quinone) n=1 Tax=Camellia sinensis TaxID=4442 RepID=A0A7J7H794_CAMSI|nr:hypothetical protein HYC85_014706 [Camellia sinensis]
MNTNVLGFHKHKAFSCEQVPETLHDEVLSKMSAPPKSDVPIITPGELAEADGFIFGFPTRFGMMAAQFKAFLDATGGLWRTQQLAGKPAGIFYSTGSQGGGQETTALTAITQLVHHGMIFVPIGYTFGAGMFEMETVKGGSPYGAGTYAGDGSRQPTGARVGAGFPPREVHCYHNKEAQGICLISIQNNNPVWHFYIYFFSTSSIPMFYFFLLAKDYCLPYWI